MRRNCSATPSPPAYARRVPALFGLIALIADGRGVLDYTFAVVGPDPADSDAVMVRAEPQRGAVGVPAVTLRLLTVAGSSGTRRLDAFGSMERAAPEVMARAKRYADRAESQTHLKRLALAVIQYQQDHDEKMPDATRWMDQIFPYVNSRDAFRDPSAPPGQVWGYAFNSALSRQSLAAFDAPASTVLLFESTKGVRNASDTGQSVPRPGRHLGGTDYAFADGHVRWFPDGTPLSYSLSGE